MFGYVTNYTQENRSKFHCRI